MTERSAIAGRWAAVRAEVDAAAVAAGRAPADVTVVAVSKLHPVAAIAEAAAAGITDVGENYAQELDGKRDQVAGLRWHFIGKLQRNKVKLVVGRVALIHAVDGEALAIELGKRAAALGVIQPVLMAINVGGEDQKSGVTPATARSLLEVITAQPALRCDGLMTMPPLADDPEASRPYFRALRQLRDDLATAANPLAQLSMGTTSDYQAAIAEGATLVRIGTAIFGARS